MAGKDPKRDYHAKELESLYRSELQSVLKGMQMGLYPLEQGKAKIVSSLDGYSSRIGKDLKNPEDAQYITSLLQETKVEKTLGFGGKPLSQLLNGINVTWGYSSQQGSGAVGSEAGGLEVGPKKEGGEAAYAPPPKIESEVYVPASNSGVSEVPADELKVRMAKNGFRKYANGELYDLLEHYGNADTGKRNDALNKINASLAGQYASVGVSGTDGIRLMEVVQTGMVSKTAVVDKVTGAGLILTKPGSPEFKKGIFVVPNGYYESQASHSIVDTLATDGTQGQPPGNTSHQERGTYVSEKDPADDSVAGNQGPSLGSAATKNDLTPDPAAKKIESSPTPDYKSDLKRLYDDEVQVVLRDLDNKWIKPEEASKRVGAIFGDYALKVGKDPKFIDEQLRDIRVGSVRLKSLLERLDEKKAKPDYSSYEGKLMINLKNDPDLTRVMAGEQVPVNDETFGMKNYTGTEEKWTKEYKDNQISTGGRGANAISDALEKKGYDAKEGYNLSNNLPEGYRFLNNDALWDMINKHKYTPSKDKPDDGTNDPKETMEMFNKEVYKFLADKGASPEEIRHTMNLLISAVEDNEYKFKGLGQNSLVVNPADSEAYKKGEYVSLKRLEPDPGTQVSQTTGPEKGSGVFGPILLPEPGDETNSQSPPSQESSPDLGGATAHNSPDLRKDLENLSGAGANGAGKVYNGLKTSVTAVSNFEEEHKFGSNAYHAVGGAVRGAARKAGFYGDVGTRYIEIKATKRVPDLGEAIRGARHQRDKNQESERASEREQQRPTQASAPGIGYHPNAGKSEARPAEPQRAGVVEGQSSTASKVGPGAADLERPKKTFEDYARNFEGRGDPKIAERIRNVAKLLGE